MDWQTFLLHNKSNMWRSLPYNKDAWDRVQLTSGLERDSIPVNVDLQKLCKRLVPWPVLSEVLRDCFALTGVECEALGSSRGSTRCGDAFSNPSEWPRTCSGISHTVCTDLHVVGHRTLRPLHLANQIAPTICNNQPDTWFGPEGLASTWEPSRRSVNATPTCSV